MQAKCIKCKTSIGSEREGQLFTRSSSEPVMVKAKRIVVPRHFWLCSRCTALAQRRANVHQAKAA